MSETFNINKRSAGVFWTAGDPFGYSCFKEWFADAVAGKDTVSICEPYAGENSLLLFLVERYGDLLEGKDVQWSAYDITPPEINKFPDAPVVKANTLLKLPSHVDIVITNPPYLARNSARRRGLDFPFDYVGTGIESPQDLYQIALDTCLRDSDWVCFLIPESFITSKYDKSCLRMVISLPGDLFNDTDCPVCLALFGSDNQDDFDVYNSRGENLGKYSSLKAHSDAILASAHEPVKMTFNDPNGILGLRGIDGTSKPSIEFIHGTDIPSNKIKNTSRSLTRISFDDIDIEDHLDDVITHANKLIEKWREDTNDVFLTAFKGIRKDGKYRRRLSFDIAAKMLTRSLEELGLLH